MQTNRKIKNNQKELNINIGKYLDRKVGFQFVTEYKYWTEIKVVYKHFSPLDRNLG